MNAETDIGTIQCSLADDLRSPLPVLPSGLEDESHRPPQLVLMRIDQHAGATPHYPMGIVPPCMPPAGVL